MNWWQRLKKQIVLPRDGEPTPPDARDLLIARLQAQVKTTLPVGPPAVPWSPEESARIGLIYGERDLKEAQKELATVVKNSDKKVLEAYMGVAVMLIGILAQVADGVLNSATKLKWPQEIIDALVAASSAISTAHTLAVTKAGLEANRQ